MSANVNDIVEARITGQFLGQQTENMFYFQCTAANASDSYLEDLLAQIVDVILDPVGAVLSTSQEFTYARLKNLTQGLDFFEDALSFPGELSGAVLPPYVTFTVKLIRSTLLTRNGSKRYSGLTETAVADNTINWVALQKTAIEDAHAATLEPAGASAGQEWRPVIVGRTYDPVEDEYFLDLTKINPIASAAAGLRVSSQVSRKVVQAY